jgi:phosphoglycolate/pyridoxal phosphate phosphatase family enzyme
MSKPTFEEIKKFIDSHDTFLLDCDGVLWHGEHLIENIKETLELLRKLKKNLFFITNNSTKSRKAYSEKFKTKNIPVSEDEIFCSSFIVADYLKVNHPEVKKVYLIGESGIEEELKIAGIETMDSKDHLTDFMDEAKMKSIPEKEIQQVDAVVCGWDRRFNFFKLTYACFCFQLKPDCLFFATNEDFADRVDEKRLIPGAGIMVNAVKYAVKKDPVTTGKPNPHIVEKIAKERGLDKSKMVMIGDNLDTDIMLGINSKITTALVLSGVTSEDMLLDSKIQPNFIFQNLGELIKYLQ